MSPNRRISVGFPGSDDADNEWHRKIRDILDIKPNVAVKCNGKKAPFRRRTVCCESPIVARESPNEMQHEHQSTTMTKVRDDSTAAISFSSCDMYNSPASIVRPELSSLCRPMKNCMSSSPTKDHTKQDVGVVLAKHRINSPRRSSTGSPCASSPRSPFAETKSPPPSPFSKAQVVEKPWLNDDDLPDVPFSPHSDHGSCEVFSSEKAHDLAAEESGDDSQSPVSIYKDHFRSLNGDYADKSHCNKGRRSSYCDPPLVPHDIKSKVGKSSYPVPRRSSCPDEPPRSHQTLQRSPPSEKIINNDNILQSPLYSTPKAATPSFSIKVQRRSSCGELSLPFAPDGSKSSRRSSSKIDSANCRVYDARESRSLLYHQKRRTSNTNAPCVIPQAKTTRRISDIVTSENCATKVQRRRASDYDIPYSVPLTSTRINHGPRKFHRTGVDRSTSMSEVDGPPISMLIIETKSSRETEKIKLKRDPPARSSRPSSFAFF